MEQGHDKEIASVLLGEHKLMASSLTTLILEANNDQLRSTAMRSLERVFQHQKQIYDAMSQRGWYQVQSASQQDIARFQSQHSNMM